MIELLKEKIIEEYNNGLTVRELSDKYGCGKTTIYRKLKGHTKPLFEAKRKYSINDHYFDTIDNEIKAYILGFICADGNLYNSTIQIEIKQEDEQILQLINNNIYNDGLSHIKTRTREYNILGNTSNNTHSKLDIYSKYMYESLISKGITTSKSLTLLYPKVIENAPMDLQRHFIRGYFDGDGSISVYQKLNYYQVDICTTMEFGLSIKNLVEQTLQIHCGVIKKGNPLTNTYKFQITGNRQVKKFCDWMYGDSTFYLQRKYNKYQNLVAHLSELDKNQ